jgi:hypothetical protein
VDVTTKRIGPTRMYLPRGTVAHLLPRWSVTRTRALCGLGAGDDYWRGTGSQDEYEKATVLRTCSRCERGEQDILRGA